MGERPADPFADNSEPSDSPRESSSYDEGEKAELGLVLVPLKSEDRERLSLKPSDKGVLVDASTPTARFSTPASVPEWQCWK